MAERTRVAVVFGGRSGEHEISCRSAAGILGHLDVSRYDTLAVRIAPDGRWSVDGKATGVRVWDSMMSALEILRGVDVVFPALHGPYGEDGTLQSALELLGVPYVGNGVLASAAGMAKDVTKTVLAAEGLRVADGVVLRLDDAPPCAGGPPQPGELRSDLATAQPSLGTAQPSLGTAQPGYGTAQPDPGGSLPGLGVVLSGLGAGPRGVGTGLPGFGAELPGFGSGLPDPDGSLEEARQLPLPVYVKPARAGSSLGVSRVEAWEDLGPAVIAARKEDPRVLVETAVSGREVDLGVLEYPDGRLEVGPPLEILVGERQEFFDYAAKYDDAGTVFQIPAALDPAIHAVLTDRALRAFRALNCRGLLRVDFFLPADGSEPVLNEVNTFPGFTAASQFPRIWAAAGVSYPDLLDILIATALAR